MSTKTNILGLVKPAAEDFYNVDDFNENFQKIDEFLEKLWNNIFKVITNNRWKHKNFSGLIIFIGTNISVQISVIISKFDTQ